MYQYFVALIIGFLLGSLPFAWIIVKITTGKDVRDEGSGSVSTRNTIRTAGYLWAILTATLDVTKGFLAAFLTRFYIAKVTASFTFELSIFCTALAGIAAFAGHCWMPWMKFKGGKGFAVFSGALAVINPWGIIVWWLGILIYLLITRYSGISGILATASVALLNTFFYIFSVWNPYWSAWGTIVFGWGCVILAILRHIPDFKGMKTGEIKRWKGIKVSQWMR